jgi:hypothetical protein
MKKFSNSSWQTTKDKVRTGGRVAYGDALLRRWAFARVGSNPTPSVIFTLQH